MTLIRKSPVASGIFFDGADAGYTSNNVNDAVIESQLRAEGKPRAFVGFWEFSDSVGFLYHLGQTKSDSTPFVVASDSILREISCSGGQNNNNSLIMFAIYATTGTVPTNFGTLASATQQNMTFSEGDFPYTGTTRVTVEIVNNGPSLPLAFSEDIGTRTVTIQLATNGAGNVTTRRRDLRDGFALNSSIMQLYNIDSSNDNTLVTPQTFTLSGGDASSVVGSVFMRASRLGYREGYEAPLPAGMALMGRVHSQPRGSFSPVGLNCFLSFGVT